MVLSASRDTSLSLINLVHCTCKFLRSSLAYNVPLLSLVKQATFDESGVILRGVEVMMDHIHLIGLAYSVSFRISRSPLPSPIVGLVSAREVKGKQARKVSAFSGPHTNNATKRKTAENLSLIFEHSRNKIVKVLGKYRKIQGRQLRGCNFASSLLPIEARAVRRWRPAPPRPATARAMAHRALCPRRGSPWQRQRCCPATRGGASTTSPWTLELAPSHAACNW